MPTEVKEYCCDYCGRKGFFSEESARAHEEGCIKNPKISEEWEECSWCKGTGNHYGKQRPGIVGYARCSSCNGQGRRKRKNWAKIVEDVKAKMAEADARKKGGVKIE